MGFPEKWHEQDTCDTMVIKTNRLILRQWKPTDLEPFAMLNSDPEVMEYFPKILSRIEGGTPGPVSLTRYTARFPLGPR